MNTILYLITLLSLATPILSMQPNAPITVQRLKQVEAAQVLAILEVNPVTFRPESLWRPLAPKQSQKVEQKITTVPRTGGSVAKKEYPGQITIYNAFNPQPNTK